MDSRQVHNAYLGNPQESLEYTASAGFTGMVDEFLVFGGPSRFDDQLLSRSLFEVDSLYPANFSNGSGMVHTPLVSRQGTSSHCAQSDPCASSLRRPMSGLDISNNSNDDCLADRTDKPRCWDHGCNGREFSSKSNLMRHTKEKSGASNKCCCPLCGAIFTRSSARDTHLAKQSCNKIRRYSNGRPRPSRLAVLENPQLAAAAAGTAHFMTQDQIHWQSIEAIEWDVGPVGGYVGGG